MLDEKTRELLEEAREALAPKHKDNDRQRDTYECGGCAGWTYVALPAHSSGIRCDDFCRGGHESREIEHADYCVYMKIDRFLKNDEATSGPELCECVGCDRPAFAGSVYCGNPLDGEGCTNPAVRGRRTAS